MIKPLNFGNFQAMKKYSYNQMNAWAVSVYQSGYRWAGIHAGDSGI